MPRSSLPRLAALFLSLALLLPSAQALTLEQAKALLVEKYVEEVPEHVLEQPTIEAMLEALGDPYAAYFTPEEYLAYNQLYEEGHQLSTGMFTTLGEDGLLVNFVYPGSPADLAGLEPMDLITAVDSIPVSIEHFAEIGALLGDPSHTPSLTYLRSGETSTAQLVYHDFQLPSVASDLLQDHIGLLLCSFFGVDTAPLFFHSLQEQEEQADRWIIDLRSNPGGYLDATLETAGSLTGPGVMGYERTGAKDYTLLEYDGPRLADQPFIVLTNVFSASGAEFLACAVRDSGTGLLVGGRSYGKGIGQEIFDQTIRPALFPQGDAIKFTTFCFFSPNGTSNQTVGVIPHLLISDANAFPAAVLLSASPPQGDSAGLLQLELEQRWYIDLEQALSTGYRDAFDELLEAIPPTASLYQGMGGDDWQAVSPTEIAANYGFDYNSRGFTDRDESPYGPQIDLLGTYAVVSGDGSGAFYPNQTLTRAQLCALLAQALNCNIPTGESRFTDVDMDAWYGPAVNAIAELGLIDGVGGGLFAPDAPVDHQQLIAMLGRMARSLSIELYEAGRNMPEDALDAPALASFPEWARKEVWLLSDSQTGFLGNDVNLLWAAPEEIDPSGEATRGEAAYLVYSLLAHAGVLPL